VSTIALDIVQRVGSDGTPAVVALRVTGLTTLPPDPMLRIDPIDERLGSVPELDWPAGPRRPVAVLAGPDGATDLLLGADVVDSALLVAGTPVLISIIDTPAVAELVWPALTVRAPRRARPVIVTQDLRVAALATANARREQAAAVLAAAVGQGGAGALRRRREDGQAPTWPRLVTPDMVASGDDPRASAAAVPLVPVEGQAMAALPAATDVARATHPTPDTAPPASRARQAAAFLAGMAAAMLIVFGLSQARTWPWLPSAAVTSGAPDLPTATQNATLRAVLATGGVSPRGRPAAGVGAEAALALADNHLHGHEGAARDQGEASFWLRHALSQAVAPEPMKWALTQLGTIYAAPEGFEPDFAKARLVWEIAGAMGDPIALCFNAQLYEHGLGVTKHAGHARTLYERARQAGGCSGLEQALARLR
jgi:hypothetical protein